MSSYSNDFEQSADDAKKIAKKSGPISWMANHGVAPNLLMLFLILGGFVMSLVIRKEFIPSFDADIITVYVAYTGATPTEMEQGVLLPIENKLTALNGIKRISGSANQGSARVSVEVEQGFDKQQLYQEIQQAVDSITTFPAQIERPIVKLQQKNIDVMELVLSGPLDNFALRRLADTIEQKLLSIKQVSQVNIRGLPAEEVHIEISKNTLQSFNLTLQQVASIIQNNALEQSIGQMRTEQGDLLLTVNDRIYWAQEYAQLAIINDDMGAKVLLSDLATIKEATADSNNLFTQNGQAAVSFRVYRTGDETPLTITEAIHKQLPGIRQSLPTGIELIVADDDGDTYNQRVGLLLRNAFIGLFLVLLLLSMFLEYRLAFWVTMGIPTAFLGALLFLPMFDVSINMVSMFAFIIALGIVVDDAIIAGENIYDHMQHGDSYMTAAIAGAREVAVPLAFAILTNVAAFLPLLFLPGFMGKLFIAIPVVVISCFVISWIEALFILPAHLGRLKKHAEEDQSWLAKTSGKLQSTVDGKLQNFIENYYQPILQKCLKSPGLTLSVALAIAIIVLSIPLSGRMGFSMFPRLDGEFAVAKVELLNNAPLSQAIEIRDHIEAQVEALLAEQKELLGDDYQRDHFVISKQSYISGSDLEVEVKLPPEEFKGLSAQAFVKIWRKKIGEIAGIQSLTYDAERGGGPSGGSPINMRLKSSDTQKLVAASKEAQNFIAELGGVLDVANSYTGGSPQYDIELNALGRSLGLSARDVATQVRSAITGARALRQQRGKNEVTVLVRLPQDERHHASDIENLSIKTAAGGYVLLADIATLHKDIAPAKIKRQDGKQVINISAQVEVFEQVPAINEAIRSQLFTLLNEKYPNVITGFGGRQEETDQTLTNMKVGALFCLLLIYILLAIPFQSYLQPLLVMAVIPFGVVGATVGHLILGYSMSIMSIMGMLALAGVLVNDSLILIDYANKQKAKGLSAIEAISAAGRRRFRPILLTTLTTFGGLSPMVFETSRQAQFITPMAVSLGFGILFTTFICLLVLPSLYLLLSKTEPVIAE